MRTRSNALLMLGLVLVFMIAANAANAPTLKDINSTGDIVYEILNSSGENEEAVLFHGGEYYTVDYPNSAATSGFGINDDSVLVGEYQVTATGFDNGFKVTY
jgi:hypothetical protein